MNAFIKKYKKLFKFYYVALRLSGWLLLTLGICSTAITIILVNTLDPATFKLTTLNVQLRSLEFILFGLLGLGIAQLIRYLIDGNHKPGLMLRHGGKFLYVYVILLFFVMILRNVFTKSYFNPPYANAQTIYYLTSITSLILFMAKALILIGLAQFLKRIIPVIEEQKSLV